MIVAALAALLAAAPQTPPAPPAPPARATAPALAALKAKGAKASLAIFPVHLGGEPADPVTELVGCLLEQDGLQRVEPATVEFSPRGHKDLDALAAALGATVRRYGIPTDYALHCEFNGPRGGEVDEMRAVLVGAAGETVLTWRLAAGEPDFPEPGTRHPLALAIVLERHLAERIGLDEATAKAAKPGAMTRMMELRSGLPPEAERDAIPGRLAAWRTVRAKATVLVAGARSDGAADAAAPADLAKSLTAAGLAAKALPAPLGLAVPSLFEDPQKALWDLAREFREHLRRTPLDADYVLFSDGAVADPTRRRAWTLVCDRWGDWVVVDAQEPGHVEIEAAKPASPADLRRFTVQRLLALLAAPR